MKKTAYILSGLAFFMIVTAGTGKAWAYFSTYVEAKGGYTIDLGDRTEIKEEFFDWKKRIVIESDAESEPVYVRARAFCGDPYALTALDEYGKWENRSAGYPEGEYCFEYTEVLRGGASTEELVLEIRLKEEDFGGNLILTDIPKDAEEGDTFNVVVLYESVPVRYDENGDPYADWEQMLEPGGAE